MLESQNALKHRPSVKARFKGQRARMAERAERIRELHAQGLSWVEMAEVLQTGPGMIRRQAIGLGLPANYRGRVRISP